VSALLAAGVLLTLRTQRERRGSVDYVGGVLVGLALLALTLALSGRAVAALEGYRPLLYAAAAVLGAAFVLHERRVRMPLLPLELFRRAGFSAANAGSILTGVALIVALVEVPFYATLVRGDSATEGGLTLLRLTALIPVGAVLGGWLGGRVPLRAVGTAGMLVATAGFVRLSFWGLDTGEVSLSLDLALTGLGFGLVLAPLAASALGAAGPRDEAIAAGTLTIARMLGMMLGLASLTTWALATFRERVSTVPLPLPRQGQSARAYHALVLQYQSHVRESAVYVFDRLFLVAAVLCLLGAVPALWLRQRSEQPVAREA
jgi:hypothetical protein